jgi:hypothetical protein
MDEQVIYVFHTRGGDADIFSSGNQHEYQRGNSAMFNCVTWQVTSGEPVNFELGIVSYPHGPNFQGYTWFRDKRGFAITKTVADPKTIYKIYEEYNSWYGADEEWHERNWRDGTARHFQTAADYARLTEIGRRMHTFDYLISMHSAAFLGSIIGDIYNNGMSVAQSIEAQRPILMEIISEVTGE